MISRLLLGRVLFFALLVHLDKEMHHDEINRFPSLPLRFPQFVLFPLEES